MGGVLQYIPHWDESKFTKKESIDLIISNAVMEHIIDIEFVYKIMFDWLKPGGWCSHVIDYGAHELSENWYQHLYVNKRFWNFLMHGRMYPINRYPHSFHIKVLKKLGYEIIYENKTFNKKADKRKISSTIKNLFSEEDLVISGAHIILRKPQE